MSFVLDASVTLSWCFADERLPETDKLLESIVHQDIYVPGLWSLEVGNILLLAVRKKRITEAGVAEFSNLLDSLDIHTDVHTAARGFHEILSLASAHCLTTYDAAYLELAMRMGLPIATKDQALIKVSKMLHVPLIF